VWFLHAVASGVMAASVFDDLLTSVHDEERRGSAKVTVVGSGQVGMASAFALMTQVAEIHNRVVKIAHSF